MEKHSIKFFAVKSKFFSIYEAFRKEMETLGWKHRDNFSTWSPTTSCSCIFVHSEWGGTNSKQFAFSNTGSGTMIYDLDNGEFGEAIEHAKNLSNPTVKMQLTKDYVAVVTKNGIQVGCQTITKDKFKELITLAKSVSLID